jgi:hypothetical protein
MERVFPIAAVIVLLGIGPSAAQIGAPSTPGAGTMSPFGTIVPTSPIGGSGIPLGATELFVGGLSPAPVGPTDGSTTCPDPTISGASVRSSSVIDSGATTGNSAGSMTSTGCGAAGTGSPLSAGLSSVPGSSAVTSSVVTSLGGADIPLGATQPDVTGLSPPITVPVPGASSSSCPGAGGIITGVTAGLGSGIPTLGPAGSSGISLPFGC